MMTNLLQVANKPRPQNVSCHTILSSFSRLQWTALVSGLVLFIIVYYDIRMSSYAELSRVLNSSSYSNAISLVFPEVSFTTASTSTESTSPAELVIDMDDRIPTYRLATKYGGKPYTDGNLAQAKLLEDIRLYETCQRDPSTTVVDVGAYLGDFGLYAAACGCTVYMFEIQTDMIDLIRSSIKHNYFSSSRVFVHQNAVSDLPADTPVRFMPEGSSTSISNGMDSVQTVRLDDILSSIPSIYLLKVDVEGSELNVLRSAKTLFAQRRIRHVIFKYTAWWTDRAPQETLIPYVRRELKAKFIYTLDRTERIVYGPLLPRDLNTFHEHHLNTRVQTDVYAVFDSRATRSSIKSQRYTPNNAS